MKAVVRMLIAKDESRTKDRSPSMKANAVTSEKSTRRTQKDVLVALETVVEMAAAT